MRIAMTSRYVKAYFNLLRKIRMSGRHSLDLCGPDEGLGAYKFHAKITSVLDFKKKLESIEM